MNRTPRKCLSAFLALTTLSLAFSSLLWASGDAVQHFIASDKVSGMSAVDADTVRLSGAGNPAYAAESASKVFGAMYGKKVRLDGLQLTFGQGTLPDGSLLILSITDTPRYLVYGSAQVDSADGIYLLNQFTGGDTFSPILNFFPRSKANENLVQGGSVRHMRDELNTVSFHKNAAGLYTITIKSPTWTGDNTNRHVEDYGPFDFSGWLPADGMVCVSAHAAEVGNSPYSFPFGTKAEAEGETIAPPDPGGPSAPGLTLGDYVTGAQKAGDNRYTLTGSGAPVYQEDTASSMFGAISADKVKLDGLKLYFNQGTVPDGSLLVFSLTDIQRPLLYGSAPADSANGIYLLGQLTAGDAPSPILNFTPRAKSNDNLSAGGSVRHVREEVNTISFKKGADGAYTVTIKSPTWTGNNAERGVEVYGPFDFSDWLPADGRVYASVHMVPAAGQETAEASFVFGVEAEQEAPPLNPIPSNNTNGFAVYDLVTQAKALESDGITLTGSGSPAFVGADSISKMMGAIRRDKVPLDGLTLSFTRGSLTAPHDMAALSITDTPRPLIYEQAGSESSKGIFLLGDLQKDDASPLMSFNVMDKNSAGLSDSGGVRFGADDWIRCTFDKGKDGRYTIRVAVDDPTLQADNVSRGTASYGPYDFSGWLPADGLVYAAAYVVPSDSAVKSTSFRVTPKAVQPPIFEEIDRSKLINGFYPAQKGGLVDGVYTDLRAESYQYNGITLTGKGTSDYSDTISRGKLPNGVSAIYADPVKLDGLKIDWNLHTMPYGNALVLSLSDMPCGLAHTSADVSPAKGFYVTLQNVEPDISSAIVNTFVWQKNATAFPNLPGQGFRLNYGEPNTLYFHKLESGLYELRITNQSWQFDAPGRESHLMDRVYGPFDLSGILNEDGKVYVSTMYACEQNVDQEISYSLAMTNAPITPEYAQKAIDKLNDLKEEDYTSATWNALISARDALQKAINESAADLQEKYDALLAARDALRSKDGETPPRVEILAEIDALVRANASLNSQDYTEESWSAYSDSLSMLKAAAADDAVGANELLGRLTHYKKRLAELVKADGRNNEPDDGSEPPDTGVALPLAAAAIMPAAAGVLAVTGKKRRR